MYPASEIIRRNSSSFVIRAIPNSRGVYNILFNQSASNIIRAATGGNSEDCTDERRKSDWKERA